ncbi:MAG: metallophosphoesterase [Cyanobacteriota bacterium]|nr:metallophosphoesterase [Cyanobacteriota bacterium]
MRLVQLSDLHLLADPGGHYRGRSPHTRLHTALAQVADLAHDLLVISGDLCQDETWQGYIRLRELLQNSHRWGPTRIPVALLPGNHDHPALLRAALGRQAVIAPARISLPGCRVLLLNSHRAGCTAGWIGARQLRWLEDELMREPLLPTLVVLHHQPVNIGDPELDAIGLQDAPALIDRLVEVPGLRGVLFGHVHQHWQGFLPGRPDRLAAIPLLGCPSTLCPFGPIQPCPLGRPADPGGRWLELDPRGHLQQRLLRWSSTSD